MDHLGLEEDQKEKLRQFTEFTHQHDYDVAVGTLASLDWNLEQAIEAHLMQEEPMNDDDDPEILETIQNNPPVRARAVPEVIDLESESMPAARGRRRGRVTAADETGVDNELLQIDDGGARNNERGAPITRRRAGAQAAEPTSSSAATSSAAGSRRHLRSHQEPAHPVAARHHHQINGSSSATSSRRHQNNVAAAPAPAPRPENNMFHVDHDSDDDDQDYDNNDDMNIAYDDDDDIQEIPHRNVPIIETSSRNPVQNGRVPMIPDGSPSVPDALRNFVTVFADRFCSTPATQLQAFMPPFYTDTLQNALKEAFEHPNSEHRRPLVFYINHDRSIASNIFASQVLCSEAISSLIRHQYILFPWDISSDANLMQFTEMLQVANMADARNLIQRLAISKVETFPMMAIVVRERNSYRLVDYCRGTDTQEQVLEKLLNGVEEYSTIRLNEASERREREERDEIRRQQEAEYKASLEADKARMAAKQREIDEQKAEEERKIREVEEEEMRRQMVASTLPEEPAADAQGVINVKFRLPEGGQDMRRFRRAETVQTLIDYLSSKGFSPEKFKYFNSDFPKKELTKHFDLSQKFENSKWPAREQIFVEEI